MDSFQKNVLGLIKSAITGEAYQLIEDFDWPRTINFFASQNMIVIFSCGLHNSKICIPDEYLMPINKAVYSYTVYSAKQESELQKIINVFSENKISTLFLKGALLSSMYPKNAMRYMCDADILIKKEEYGIIENIMREHGYEFVCESDHELIWRKPNILNIEFHKRLIPSYNKDFFKYFGDGWRLATKQNGSNYSMSDEDFLIYSFVHLAKHYRDSGVELKHFVDIWIYLNSKKFDDIYVKSELKKLDLLEFYLNVVHTISVWFENGEENNISRKITEWVFTGTDYKNTSKKILSAMLRNEIKNKGKQLNIFQKLCKMFFWPYKNMCQKYTFLKKFPILLPFMWIVRCISAITVKKNETVESINNIRNISNEQIAEYHNSLKEVGLDYNF